MLSRTVAKLLLAVAFICFGATQAFAEPPPGWGSYSYGGNYGWNTSNYSSSSGYDNSWWRDSGSYYNPYYVPGGGGVSQGGWDRGGQRNNSWSSGSGSYGGYYPYSTAPSYPYYGGTTYYQPMVSYCSVHCCYHRCSYAP